LSDPSLTVAILRYFNPVGANASVLIGKNPIGIPNNLMHFITQVLVGKRDKLLVYGNDYETTDGMEKRDYIHVIDLASGNLAALNYLSNNPWILLANLGTGRSASVLELVRAFQKASEMVIPYENVARRLGDVPEYYADVQYPRVCSDGPESMG
jgi:UDP-glucose 4-epimerase